MELIIYNQQEVPEIIKFNYDELKHELVNKLSHYNSITYTEAEIKTAKTDRATLNKFKDAIETRRKEIKAQCLKPYEDFEAKVKDIVKMIDKPILAIDSQVKKFEEKVKQKKKAEIETFYAEIVGDLEELLPLAKFWNEKWLNASVAIKAVKEEITSTIAKVRNDFEVITGLQSEFELQVKDNYLRTLNLSAALQEKTRLEEQKTKQEAYAKAQAEKKAEAERLRAEAEERARAEALKQEPAKLVVETESDGHTLTKEGYENPEKMFAKQEPEVTPEQKVMQIDFRIWATSEQLGSLKAFLLEKGIRYGKVV